ncbi:S8 family serine peptidase [Terriglobus aquaticus]|nr:S8 family serine peptidase [Terriglobus aquaticus]
MLAQLAVLVIGSLAPQAIRAQAPSLTSPTIPGHYLVLFCSGTAVSDRAQRLRETGASEVTVHPHLGTAAVSASATAMRRIAADPTVAQVLPDVRVYAHALLRSAAVPEQASGSVLVRRSAPVRPVAVDPLQPVAINNSGSGNAAKSGSGTPASGGGSGTASTPAGTQAAGASASSNSGNANTPAPTDTFYQGSPQGWAVRAAGGYGMGVLGGTVTGPWNRTLGSGVRIAVLDSGVDRTHPDIAPNLALNLSEVDSSDDFSPCDDGSPQDQEGHGTWVASLAAGAMGASTGRVVGVAPSATILNIKVLQRMPGTGVTVSAQCQAGQASGLVSWLLKGIDDAVSQHADVIVLSLGSIVDLYTGDGAGLKSAFDQVTHAAANAGVLIVAAAGNDGFDLSNSRYLELPAQARDVLAVTATSNPDCAEDNRTGAACSAGAVTLPYYSNYGAPLQAVAAPGGNYPAGADEAVSGWIRGACSSGVPGTADGAPSDHAHSYGCFNFGHAAYVQAMGTSASAGLAAGAAALLRATHPAWTPAELAAAMRSGTTALKGGSTLLDTNTAMQR